MVRRVSRFRSTYKCRIICHNVPAKSVIKGDEQISLIVVSRPPCSEGSGDAGRGELPRPLIGGPRRVMTLVCSITGGKSR